MARKQDPEKSHRAAETGKKEQETAQWVIETVGELGMGHDTQAKHDLLDGYCEESEPSEKSP